MNGVSALMRDPRASSSLPPCEDTVRSRKWALARLRIHRHFDLGLPATRVVRNIGLWFKTPVCGGMVASQTH